MNIIDAEQFNKNNKISNWIDQLIEWGITSCITKLTKKYYIVCKSVQYLINHRSYMTEILILWK